MKRAKKSLFVDASGSTTDFTYELADNMNAKNYKSMIENMNGDAAAELNRYMKSLRRNSSISANGSRFTTLSNYDSYLKNIG